MPTDKKDTRRTSCPQKKKRQYSAKRADIIKCRRQERYKQICIDKREELLLQRRTKRLQSKSPALPNNLCTSKNNEAESSIKTVVELIPQTTLTITEPSCLPVNGLVSMLSAKGKDIVGHFCIFEQGSTSATPGEGHNSQSSLSPSTILLSTSGPRNPTTVTGRNKDNHDDQSTYNIVYSEIIKKALL